jgi:lipoprotein-anchoring transpeptidase ErfK/SrfK
VRRRRHAPRRTGLTRVSILLAVAAVLVALFGGAAYAGYRYERTRAARILPGVRIAGIDVSGMTLAEARTAIAGPVRSILSRPIQITVGDRSWDLSPAVLGAHVDVDSALNQALAVSQGFDWPSRLYHRVLDKPVQRSFDLPVTYNDDVVATFVHKVADQVIKAPRDAYLDFVDGQLIRRHSREGQRLRVRTAVAELTAAVHGTGASVDLPLAAVHPTVADRALGKTIIIRLSQNKLYLYDGLGLEKSYSVATGQLGIYPTPQGHWTIVNKRINPTWVNPAKDTWGADEPAFIPPGPDNPLGTRALDLDAPGIRIHGSPADSSIGHWASHGCIRMHIPDSEDLFNRVDIGTPVIIVW